jgi:hypothetical protein
MMRRREFIAELGSAVGSSTLRPISVQAQRPAMPVIGVLHYGAPPGFDEVWCEEASEIVRWTCRLLQACRVAMPSMVAVPEDCAADPLTLGGHAVSRVQEFSDDLARSATHQI